MNRILKIFRYAGLATLILALLTVVIRLVSTYIDYGEGKTAVVVVENNPEKVVKLIDGAVFTDLHIGQYEFKPTFIQLFILANDTEGSQWAIVVFCSIMGGLILFMVYLKPAVLEKLSEKGLEKAFLFGFAFFLLLKAFFMWAIDRYILNLTHYKFGAPKIGSFDISLAIFFLLLIERIISALLSYSKKLKEEIDLTI